METRCDGGDSNDKTKNINKNNNLQFHGVEQRQFGQSNSHTNVMYINPLFISGKCEISQFGDRAIKKGVRYSKAKKYGTTFTIGLLVASLVFIIIFLIHQLQTKDNRLPIFSVASITLATIAIQLTAMEKFSEIQGNVKKNFIILSRLFFLTAVLIIFAASATEDAKEPVVKKMAQINVGVEKPNEELCKLIITDSDDAFKLACLNVKGRPFAVGVASFNVTDKRDFYSLDMFVDKFLNLVLMTLRNNLKDNQMMADVDKCLNFIDNAVCTAVFTGCDGSCVKLQPCDNFCDVTNAHCTPNVASSTYDLILNNIQTLIFDAGDPTTAVGEIVDGILKAENFSPDELQKVNQYKEVLFKETQNVLERIFSKNIDDCKVGFGFKGTECFNISTNELSNDLQANYRRSMTGGGECTTGKLEQKLMKHTNNKEDANAQENRSVRVDIVLEMVIVVVCSTAFASLVIKSSKFRKKRVGKQHFARVKLNVLDKMKVALLSTLTMLVAVVIFLHSSEQEKRKKRNDTIVFIVFFHFIFLFTMYTFLWQISTVFIGSVSILSNARKKKHTNFLRQGLNIYYALFGYRRGKLLFLKIILFEITETM